MNAQTWIVLGVGVALLGIVLVGFRNVRVDIARTNDRIDVQGTALTARIDALSTDIRADLGGRIDAQTARIDDLVVHSHTHDHTST